jgi:hypothetical protein
MAFVAGFSNPADGVTLIANQDLSKFNFEAIGKAMVTAMNDYKYWQTVVFCREITGWIEHHDIAKLDEFLFDVRQALAFYLSGQSGFEDVGREVNQLRSFEQEILEEQSYRRGKPRPAKSKEATIVRSPAKGYVYLLKAVSPENHYKIGLSSKPTKRIETLNVKLPFPITPIHVAYVDDMRGTESLLHERYASKRVRGEWFCLEDSDVTEIIEFLGGVQ